MAAKFVVSVFLSGLVLGAFSIPLGPLPSLGSLLDPSSGIWTVAPGSRHPRDASVLVPGLQEPVTVVRDSMGIPHIYALNPADGWYALGYVHAQDRLFQMDMLYRLGAGRLAEVLGPDFLESDRFFRTIGLNRIARGISSSPPDPGDPGPEVIEAYSAGVNAYVRSVARADLPLEFKLLDYTPEPWSNEKSITTGLLTAFSLSWNTGDLTYALLAEKLGSAAAEELFPLYPSGAQDPIEPGSGARPMAAGEAISERAVRDILRKAAAAVSVLPRLSSGGSNNWAVAGNRTTTGMPLLAADPHLEFMLPAVWYWAELHAEPYHVRGSTFPGNPGVFFGTNGHIAWGETNTGADVTDFYVETFSPDRRQYLYRGEWQDVRLHNETIRVRGGDAELLTVTETAHGPVMTELDQVVAMRSTLSEFGGELSAILGINLARNWSDFREALKNWRVPAQNFVYADNLPPSGNIAIRSNGLFPLRNGSVVPRVPLNGSSGGSEWIGFVPFDDYPEAVNPTQGFVASANQVPVGPAYPHYLGTFWSSGHRARRINSLLVADDRVSFDDLRNFQLDVRDSAAEALVPILRTVLVPRASGGDQAALDALLTWDLQFTKDSVAATVWSRFLDVYRHATFGDEYAAANVTDLPLPFVSTLEHLTLDEPTSAWFDNVSTLGTEGRNDVIQAAFEATMDSLKSDLGPDVSSWTWGSLHVRQFDHLTGLRPLSRGPFPSEGGPRTLNVAGSLVSRHGPSWRQLIDFSDTNASVAIYPGGQSGNPVSPHYDDLLPIYLRGEYLPFAGRWSASDFAASEVESLLRLLPM